MNQNSLPRRNYERLERKVGRGRPVTKGRESLEDPDDADSAARLHTRRADKWGHWIEKIKTSVFGEPVVEKIIVRLWKNKKIIHISKSLLLKQMLLNFWGACLGGCLKIPVHYTYHLLPHLIVVVMIRSQFSGIILPNLRNEKCSFFGLIKGKTKTGSRYTIFSKCIFFNVPFTLMLRQKCDF